MAGLEGATLGPHRGSEVVLLFFETYLFQKLNFVHLNTMMP